MNHRITTHLTALAAGALLLFGASQALATVTDTEADTPISNTASVTFTIGGGSPTAVTGTAAFKVDHKIRPVVAAVSGATIVPNGTGYALKFTVNNDGNTKTGQTLQLYLDAVEASGNDFTMNNVKVYADDGATVGSFDASDTNLTDSVSGLITLARDASATIYIVADAPGGITKTQTSVYHLRATAYDGSGALLSQDGDGNDAAASEAVFADDASASGLVGDGATDGKHSNSATFTANWTDLTVNKTASTPGYFLPGAAVTYTITVTNSDISNDATSVTISDPIPANTTYTNATLSCSSGTAKWSTDNGSTYSTPAPADPSTVTNVQCDGGTVAANSGTATMTFDVTID